MNIYLAAPLFTMAERRFNEDLAGQLQRICPGLDVFLPQRCDHEFLGSDDVSQKIFRRLMDSLEECDAVVALLDGPDADSGTCFEMGYAYARGKMIIGVRTDFRGTSDHGVNLMLTNSCCHLLADASPTAASVEPVAMQIIERLAKLS